MSVVLVGILNVTPDSFSDGGQFMTAKTALAQAERLIANGAGLLDLGAEATNPFVKPITAKEEIRRLKSILPVLTKKYPGIISVDTYHHETAEFVLNLGDVIINDVTTFRDPAMREVVVRHKAQVIVSHMPLAATSIIQAHHDTTISLNDVNAVKDELLAQIHKLLSAGLPADNIIADPGIGFGKTMTTNKELLEFAKVLPDFPVLIGHSRKRFIQEAMGANDKTDVATNQQAGRIAAEAGARYLRVHDPENYRSLTS